MRSFEKIIAFDVETPNAANDSMCSIGITVLENGCLADEYYYLVNPQTHFDDFNVHFHGISPKMVEDALTFPQLWDKIGGLMTSGVLAAHNAPFDMAVLSKSLRRFGIYVPPVEYVCSLSMARRCKKGLGRYTLDSLSDYYGIALDHHNAGSDARACACLVQIFAGMTDFEQCVRTYDLMAGRRIY